MLLPWNEVRLDELVDTSRAKEQMSAHPYLAVLAVAGLGLLLAGGLFTRRGLRVAAFGAARLLLPLVLGRLVR